MKRRVQKITGIILIILGLIILWQPGVRLDWYFIRSYGFFLIGVLGILRAFSWRRGTGIYWATVLTLVGLYFLLNEWGVYSIDRGLTICAITIILGLSSYPVYFQRGRPLEVLVLGNLILLLGLIFFARYLGYLPGEVLIAIVDRYWPVAFIVVGLALFIRGIWLRSGKSTSLSSPQASLPEESSEQ